MEKIYMQDSEQSSSSRSSSQSSSMFRFSIVLSFLVASFAIISLIAAGFNQISYAAPSGSSFPFYEANYSGGSPIKINASGSGAAFTVPVYLAGSSDITNSSAIPIFCLEHNTDIQNGVTYTKGENITDIGLLYIINKSRSLDGSGIVPTNFSYTTSGGTVNETAARKLIEVYSTQIAIWVYMYEKYYLSDPTNNAKYSLATSTSAEANYNIIKNANVLSVTNYSAVYGDIGLGNNFYSTYIAPVINDAKNYTGLKELSVTKANNTISKVGNDAFYQSAALSVSANPSNDLVSYDVTVSGVDGAIVVDEDGHEKTTGYSPSDKFYVRVPVKNVSQQTGKVTIEVKGKFNNYLSGAYYTSGNLQRVVSVTGTENYETVRVLFDFVGSADTGMSQSQTIIFIGIIVLLCGIGIIYANSKPVEIES